MAASCRLKRHSVYELRRPHGKRSFVCTFRLLRHTRSGAKPRTPPCSTNSGWDWRDASASGCAVPAGTIRAGPAPARVFRRRHEYVGGLEAGGREGREPVRGQGEHARRIGLHVGHESVQCVCTVMVASRDSPARRGASWHRSAEMPSGSIRCSCAPVLMA